MQATCKAACNNVQSQPDQTAAGGRDAMVKFKYRTVHFSYLNSASTFNVIYVYQSDLQ